MKSKYVKRNKTKKNKMKLKKGGTDFNYVFFSDTKTYGTKDLHLKEFHAHTIHFNRMDINIIARNFLDPGIVYYSIYTKYKKISDYADDVYDRYYKNESIQTKRNILNFLQKYEKDTIIVGEIDDDEKKGKPVFMHGKKRLGVGTVKFCDIEENEYYLIGTGAPLHPIKDGKNYKIYKFSRNDPILNHSSATQIKNSPNYVTETMKTLNVEDEEALHKQYFENLHLTIAQKKSIDSHKLSYTVLYHLNNDLSKYANTERHVYRTNERFNYFDYERIERGYARWAKKEFKDNWNKDEFKRALLVGYYDDVDNKVWHPIYLKLDGYFSSGGSDYSPTYETMVIDETILKDTDMIATTKNNVKYTHDYLIDKTAYVFEWGTATRSAIEDHFWNQISNEGSDVFDFIYRLFWKIAPSTDNLLSYVFVLPSIIIGFYIGSPFSLLSMVQLTIGFIKSIYSVYFDGLKAKDKSTSGGKFRKSIKLRYKCRSKRKRKTYKKK